LPKINVLPQHVAELIAAGEVVDRPASIVKELVENSVDAGADRIAVEIRGGGIGYIRVTDNGCGIEREDIKNAFIRHATSKVSVASDLDAIGTLGFRGEALPSIAAVSRVKVTTRTADSSLGSVFSVAGSDEGTLEDTGCPVGTTIEIRDVFYNTPARMKFLKKDVTEANAIATLLDRLALANPNVAFEFIREGKRVMQTPGDGDLLSVIRIICGSDVASNMIPVKFKDNGITVEGYISKPATSRSTRTLQIFYINSRYVRSRTCAVAVEDAYKNRLMTGRFPACVINLSIDTSLVDVNVHPSKLEVRFSSERDVYQAVYTACREALAAQERRPVYQPKKLTPFSLDDFDYSDQQTRLTSQQPSKPAVLSESKPSALLRLASKRTEPVLSFSSPKPAEEKPAFEPVWEAQETPVVSQKQEYVIKKAEEVTQKPSFERPKFNIDIEVTEKRERITPPVPEPVCEPEKIEWHVIGELFDTYILVQQGEELHLIDKHAAHERINYERLRHIGETPSERQQLLSPMAVSLPREEYFALAENPEALEKIGITAEDFGEGVILVREIPMLLAKCSMQDILAEAASKIMSNRRSLTPSVIDELLYSVACRASVMAGKKSSMQELEKVAEFVLGEEQIRFCPHGRPALLTLTKREVEKMFGRLG